MDNVSKKIRARYGLTCSQLPPQAPGFENWNYTVENVDGALQVAIKIYEKGHLVMMKILMILLMKILMVLMILMMKILGHFRWR